MDIQPNPDAESKSTFLTRLKAFFTVRNIAWMLGLVLVIGSVIYFTGGTSYKGLFKPEALDQGALVGVQMEIQPIVPIIEVPTTSPIAQLISCDYYKYFDGKECVGINIKNCDLLINLKNNPTSYKLSQTTQTKIIPFANKCECDAKEAEGYIWNAEESKCEMMSKEELTALCDTYKSNLQTYSSQAGTQDEEATSEEKIKAYIKVLNYIKDPIKANNCNYYLPIESNAKQKIYELMESNLKVIKTCDDLKTFANTVSTYQEKEYLEQTNINTLTGKITIKKEQLCISPQTLEIGKQITKATELLKTAVKLPAITITPTCVQYKTTLNNNYETTTQPTVSYTALTTAIKEFMATYYKYSDECKTDSEIEGWKTIVLAKAANIEECIKTKNALSNLHEKILLYTNPSKAFYADVDNFTSSYKKLSENKCDFGKDTNEIIEKWRTAVAAKINEFKPPLPSPECQIQKTEMEKLQSLLTAGKFDEAKKLYDEIVKKDKNCKSADLENWFLKVSICKPILENLKNAVIGEKPDADLAKSLYDQANKEKCITSIDPIFQAKYDKLIASQLGKGDCDIKINNLVTAINNALANKNQATLNTATLLYDKTNYECAVPEYLKSYYNSLFVQTGGGGGTPTNICPNLTTALTQAIDSKNLASAKTIYSTIKTTIPNCLISSILENKYQTFVNCESESQKLASAIEAGNIDGATEKYNKLIELKCVISSALKNKYNNFLKQKSGKPLPAWGAEGEWEKPADTAQQAVPASTPSALSATSAAALSALDEAHPSMQVCFDSKSGQIYNCWKGPPSQVKQKAKKPSAAKIVKKTTGTGPEVLIYFPLMVMAGYIASRIRRKR